VTLLLAAAVDLAIVLAAALGATLLMRRRPAALRHWILAAAMLVGAAAPALELVMPEWTLPWGSGFTTTAPPSASTLRFTSAAAPVVADTVAEPAPARLPWARVAVFVWMAGVLSGLLGLAVGLARLARVSARCRPIRTGPWRDTADELSSRFRLSRVEILQSTDPALLVTWGLFTPKIILPAGASAWTATRRRIVLAHEMAHIRRHDWLVHMGAEVLRAVHWINPLAWLACRRLRQESEYACDDAVLSGGVAPTEYATHLLDVARQAIGHRRTFVSAPAIAHPSTLERRIAAMLTEQRNRQPLTRRAGVIALTAVVAVALPITALAVSRAAEPATLAPDVVLTAQPIVTPATLPAPTRQPTVTITPATVAPAPNRVAVAVAQQAQPARLSVTVIDPSGAVLPGVAAAISDAQTGMRYRQVTDGAGRFTLADLMPGRYEMALTLPGFATVANVLQVAAGDNVQRTITLPLGSLEETITVVCGAPAASLAPVPSASPVAPDDAALAAERVARARGAVEASRQVRALVRDSQERQLAALAQNGPLTPPVRVGGQISVPRQIAKVNPVCPPGVIPAPDTRVVVTARIGVDGRLNDVRYVPPAAGAIMPVQEIIDSALDAVRQWGYTPTRLNNVPVEANITVHVAYRR
jgi:beta-lactamase regulating signal transducer with metallopeptidase domain